MPLRDHRGQADSFGNVLEVTVAAVADEIAAAAELVKGKSDQVPVAIVRGLVSWSSALGRDAATTGRQQPGATGRVPPR